MTVVYRPRSSTLAISLLLHAAGIAFLLTLHSAEPQPLRSVRIAVIAPHHFSPSLITPERSVHRPVRGEPRTFSVPRPVPQPASPPLAITLPDPPSLDPPDIRTPAPARAIVELPPTRMVKSAGFSSVETSGPAPARRVLATKQNFDATASASNHLTPDKTTPGKITSGTFGDASVATAAAPLSDRASLANLSAAEILSKPRPEYTEEARRLKIEGEVLLEVLFGASGDARVLRLIRGLGHGLDENAILAIRAIQFRPARRGHAAVDSTAVVHIVFQLAY